MTIDHTRLPSSNSTAHPEEARNAVSKGPADPLPDFAPVPRQCERHDGWTPERQRGFISALADTGSVRSAAKAVNMASEGAYQLRRHPEADSFRAAWEAALGHGVQRIEDVAMDRALNGVEVPVYCYGKQAGTRTVYNDYLLMFILRNRAGNRFAADARNPEFDADELRARLERQWRKNWDQENALRLRAKSEETVQAINRKLEGMKRRRLAAQSDRTRELYAEAARSEEEDEAQAYGGEDGGWEDEDGEEAEGTVVEGEAEAGGAMPQPDVPLIAGSEEAAEPERPAGPRIITFDDDPFARFRR